MGRRRRFRVLRAGVAQIRRMTVVPVIAVVVALSVSCGGAERASDWNRRTGRCSTTSGC